ncbi:formylglycine-generating enzyme family protein [Luteimonas sp. MC1750]|uniref:formylglycine-generating enzyme family protein n=1 Tax=Luteimonas sp. MC1750 TaxID=2799326 RepID=UPI001F2C46B6|nr:formylglycine-generating enzyme family protein [Luteimonas sp. MC1750]
MSDRRNPHRTRAWPRRAGTVLVLALLLAAGCGRDAAQEAATPDAAVDTAAGDGSVTISGDDRLAGSLTWRAPKVELQNEAAALDDALERADAALESGDLDAGPGSAIPLYQAVLVHVPDSAQAGKGLERAFAALLAQGSEALARAGDDDAALRRAREVAAVARSLRPGGGDVGEYLAGVDRAEEIAEINRAAEAELREGRLGEAGGGALARVRQALAVDAEQPRALQTRAAIESAMIRRAEDAAADGDFETAGTWLGHAEGVRDEVGTVADARERVDTERRRWIQRLRDEGVAALARPDGIAQARALLARMLVLAEPRNPAVAELRERIDLAVHYGGFRPGQRFTDGAAGGRGPQMVVVPHGGFSMGAVDGDPDAEDSERPRRNLRFERGFALSLAEITVAQFRRFVDATGYRTRAERRGFSMAYDERSGNFVRRSGVDWKSDFAGAPAAANLPVVHVSARDAQAYVDWLAEVSGERYRLPSEAEFEYALRAGGSSRYPWGGDAPPARAGNLTGGADRSPGGRGWSNAFDGYDDGHWGPAPVASFTANAFGLHDLEGNVSEWVADCWHDSYRRAPASGAAWVNPGCRMQVVRGGAWASSPPQTRSSWRAPSPVDNTNARVGFRVARDI